MNMEVKKIGNQNPPDNEQMQNLYLVLLMAVLPGVDVVRIYSKIIKRRVLKMGLFNYLDQKAWDIYNKAANGKKRQTNQEREAVRERKEAKKEAEKKEYVETIKSYIKMHEGNLERLETTRNQQDEIMKSIKNLKKIVENNS